MTHKTKIFYSLFFLILPTVLLAQNSIPNNIEMNFIDKNILLYTTAKDTYLRLTKQPDQIFKKRVQPLETEVSIFVNPNKKFQKYLGIGGAITDASSEVFSKLSSEIQNQLLEAYYGAE